MGVQVENVTLSQFIVSTIFVAYCTNVARLETLYIEYDAYYRKCSQNAAIFSQLNIIVITDFFEFFMKAI